MHRIAPIVLWTSLSTSALALTVSLQVGVPCELPDDVTVTDVAYVPDEDAYAVSDSRGERFFVLDERCEVLREIDTGALGLRSPVGLAYHPVERTFALIDAASDDTLHRFDALGNLLGTIVVDTLEHATDVDYDASSGGFVVVDRIGLDLVRIDPSGVVLGRLSTAACGASNLDGATYDPDEGRYLALDAGFRDEKIRMLAPDGSCLDEVRVDIRLEGLSYVPGRRRIPTVDEFGELAWVDVRGQQVHRTELPERIDSPTDLALLDGLGQIVLADAATATLAFIDRDGTLLRTCDTAGLGVDQPSGVAYLRGADELGVLDAEADRVYIVDRSTCAAVREFGTAPFKADVPSGLGSLPLTDELLITESVRDSVVLVTPDGEPVGGLPVIDGDGPRGAAYLTEAAGWAVASEAFEDHVRVIDATGLPIADLHVGLLGLTDVRDVEVDRGSGQLVVLDAASRTLYSFSLPALAEPTGVTGRYEGEIEGTTLALRLLELARGAVSGSLDLGDRTVPAPGHLTSDGSLVLTVVLEDAEPAVLTGTIGAGFRELSFPEPLGRLVRR